MSANWLSEALRRFMKNTKDVLNYSDFSQNCSIIIQAITLAVHLFSLVNLQVTFSWVVICFVSCNLPHKTCSHFLTTGLKKPFFIFVRLPDITTTKIIIIVTSSSFVISVHQLHLIRCIIIPYNFLFFQPYMASFTSVSVIIATYLSSCPVCWKSSVTERAAYPFYWIQVTQWEIKEGLKCFWKLRELSMQV